MRWLGRKENPGNAHSSSHSGAKVKGQGASLRLRTSQATSVSWIVRVLKETKSCPAGGERGGSRGGKTQPWPILTVPLTISGKFTPESWNRLQTRVVDFDRFVVLWFCGLTGGARGPGLGSFPDCSVCKETQKGHRGLLQQPLVNFGDKVRSRLHLNCDMESGARLF